MRHDTDEYEEPRNRSALHRKGTTGPLVIALMVILVAGIVGGGLLYGNNHGWFGTPANTAGGGSTVVNQAPPNLGAQCSQNPAYTYSNVDYFASGTTMQGTDEIKNNNDAPVTSLASPKAGASLQYWKSNSSWFSPVVADTASCGSQTLQGRALQNGTVTLAIRDTDNDVSLSNSGTAGTQNVTIGANGVSNLEVRYSAAAKKAVMPFGGCVAVEVPTTITGVVMNGAGIDSLKPCPYTWTYTVSATTNTYRLFAVPKDFDSNGAGDLKRISLQLTAGSSNPSAAAAVTFQPANYYITNDGKFALGIEKDLNQDTTQTMPGGAKFNFHID